MNRPGLQHAVSYGFACAKTVNIVKPLWCICVLTNWSSRKNSTAVDQCLMLPCFETRKKQPRAHRQTTNDRTNETLHIVARCCKFASSGHWAHFVTFHKHSTEANCDIPHISTLNSGISFQTGAVVPFHCKHLKAVVLGFSTNGGLCSLTFFLCTLDVKHLNFVKNIHIWIVTVNWNDTFELKNEIFLSSSLNWLDSIARAFRINVQ